MTTIDPVAARRAARSVPGIRIERTLLGGRWVYEA